MARIMTQKQRTEGPSRWWEAETRRTDTFAGGVLRLAIAPLSSSGVKTAGLSPK